MISSIVKHTSNKNSVLYNSLINSTQYQIRTYAKQAPAAAAAATTPVVDEPRGPKEIIEDTRSNGVKLFEKFKIPRIFDHGDPKLKEFQHLMKCANERIQHKDAEKNQDNTNTAGAYQGKFRLTSSVIIERFPSLVPLPNEYEQKYLDSCERLEELIRREPIHMMSLVEDLPEMKEDDTKDQSNTQADELEEDFTNYTPEPRTTQDDIQQNTQSLNRHLDKSLYLIIQKAGSRYTWQFPSTNWVNGESIKNTAERALRDSCGSSWKYWIPSQSPCGVFKYRVESELQDLLKAEGIKEFFFRSHYFGGDLKFNSKIVLDYKWVSKEELKDYLDEEYYESVVQFIYDDCYYGYI
ncbi:hypothetical protein CYY_008299 [Polysphondylium violaceum]|uniref:Large ribosomal subunit protein mL46 n=1 Tax=Polysphondylium violaceum TaxID=133409 RepID=A0A8J4PPG9_9MYCE|nr:hypothetical protein CYY_008299 [Polysphondylium violaceum]